MKWIMLILALLMILGCKSEPVVEVPSTTSTTLASIQITTTTVKSESAPKLAWLDPKHPERDLWSRELVASVVENWSKLSKATDMKVFCPSYYKLEETEKVMAFSQFMVWLFFFESAWDPTSRYKEKGAQYRKGDPITGEPVYSEGLGQLSYQDEQWIKCGFDWSIDKKLSRTDPKKTILDPIKNLKCSVKIMAKKVSDYNEVMLKHCCAYWNVIKEGIKEDKIDSIRAKMIQTFPSCK